jgi:hypothetical protein
MEQRYDNRLNRYTPSCWRDLVKSAEERAEECLGIVQQVTIRAALYRTVLYCDMLFCNVPYPLGTA